MRHPILFIFLLTACQQSTSSIVPPSFNRPDQIALVCYRQSDGILLTLESCDGVDLEDDDEDLRLIALVTQTAKGEVGAVDLQEQSTLDSNSLVPGYTFVRVGESPSAIIVPADFPEITFVANFGSRTVQSLPTSSFLPDAEQNTIDSTTIAFETSPTDLIYYNTGTQKFLFAALPESGSIAQMAVTENGLISEATLIPLSSITSEGIASSDTIDDTIKNCPLNDAQFKPVTTPRAPTALGTGAAPIRLLIVERNSTIELLAADGSLPLIHRFSLTDTGITELDSIHTGVPLLDMAVTPLVPGTAGETNASLQFIYAIDATDRSVLAIDYTEGSPTLGAVLSVSANVNAPDRISLHVPARSLHIVTPDYELDEDNDVTSIYCDGSSDSDTQEDAVPSSLRGVFLMVASTDGTIRVVDVFDLDAQCRGGEECVSPPYDEDVYVKIRRHRPRINEFVEELSAVVNQPPITYENSSGRLDDEGNPIGEDGPGLDFLTTCPGTDNLFAPAYPTTDSDQNPLVCVSRDPWSLREEQWYAVWEGTITGTQNIGSFETEYEESSGQWFVVNALDFCEYGVLGSENVTTAGLAETDPEYEYEGDLLVITGEPSVSRASDPECALFLTPDDEDDAERFSFQILESRKNALRIGSAVPQSNATIDYTFDKIASCFTELTSFEIRSQHTFTITADETTVRHRIVANVSNICEVDTVTYPIEVLNPSTYRSFRAFPDKQFISNEIIFQIRTPSGGLRDGGTATLTLAIGQVPSQLGFDAGSLVQSMLWSDIDEHFYVIDSSNTGLSSWELSPISRNFTVF